MSSFILKRSTSPGKHIPKRKTRRHPAKTVAILAFHTSIRFPIQPKTRAFINDNPHTLPIFSSTVISQRRRERESPRVSNYNKESQTVEDKTKSLIISPSCLRRQSCHPVLRRTRKLLPPQLPLHLHRYRLDQPEIAHHSLKARQVLLKTQRVSTSRNHQPPQLPHLPQQRDRVTGLPPPKLEERSIQISISINQWLSDLPPTM